MQTNGSFAGLDRRPLRRLARSVAMERRALRPAAISSAARRRASFRRTPEPRAATSTTTAGVRSRTISDLYSDEYAKLDPLTTRPCAGRDRAGRPPSADIMAPDEFAEHAHLPGMGTAARLDRLRQRGARQIRNRRGPVRRVPAGAARSRRRRHALAHAADRAAYPPRAADRPHDRAQDRRSRRFRRHARRHQRRHVPGRRQRAHRPRQCQRPGHGGGGVARCGRAAASSPADSGRCRSGAERDLRDGGRRRRGGRSQRHCPAAGARATASATWPMCCRSRRESGGGPARAMRRWPRVFLRKATIEAPSPPETIARHYGLTPTELRVLLAIVAGRRRAGSSRGARYRRGDGEDPPASPVRQDPAPAARPTSSSWSPDFPILWWRDPHADEWDISPGLSATSTTRRSTRRCGRVRWSRRPGSSAAGVQGCSCARRRWKFLLRPRPSPGTTS